jgi:tetratricopeptide (TPR) repeat protein
MTMADTERMVVLLTPDDERLKRVDAAAFNHFLIALVREIERSFVDQPPDEPLVIQTSLALLPGGRRLIEVDTSPTRFGGEIRRYLTPRLRSLPAPPVSGGPVAVMVRSPSPLASSESRIERFPTPFETFFSKDSDETLEQLLVRLAGLAPPLERPVAGRGFAVRLRRWWQRLRLRWLRSRQPQEDEVPADRIDLTQDLAEQRQRYHQLADSGDLAPLEDVEHDAEQLSDLITRYPHDPRLYGLRGDCYKTLGDFERAIADYTELLERLPHNSSGYLVRAESFFLSDERQLALADVNRALDCNPHNSAAWALRAAMLWDLGAFEHAMSDYGMAVQNDPRCAIWYCMRARRYAAQSCWESALVDCDAALRCDPHDPQAHLLRAMLRRQQADSRGTLLAEVDEILADCDAALLIEPEHAESWSVRADIKLAARELASAERDCESALQRDPDCVSAYAVRAQIHRRRGEFEQAKTDCTAAIERQTRDMRVWLCRAESHLALDEIEEALSDCGHVIQSQPEGVDGYNLRAQIYLSQGDFDAAIEDCTAAIENDPQWYAGYMVRGHARQCLGDLEAALEDLDRAVQLAPQDATSRFHRGSVLHRLDRNEEALADLDRAVVLDSELTEAYFQRSIIWMEESEFEKALADLDDVLLREPDFAPAYFNRGNVYRWQGNLDAALRDFDAVIDLCPTLAPAYSCRGDIWIDKGDQERAQQDYREAIHLDPGAAEHFTLQRLMAEAMHHQRREQYAEVIARASEAIELEPAFLPAFAIRAGAYWYTEQHVEAVEDYTHLLEEAGETFFALNGRGQVFAEMGEYSAALNDLNRALELAEKDPPGIAAAYAHNGRGLALAGLERYEDAQQEFEASRAIAPDNAWLDYNQGRVHHQRRQPQQAVECFRSALEKKSPQLTPRKRSRVRAYLASLEKTTEPKPATGS